MSPKRSRLIGSLAGALMAAASSQSAYADFGCLWHRIFGGSQEECCQVVPAPAASADAPATGEPSPLAPSAPPATGAAISPEQFAALGGSSIAIADSQTGYIDSAIPRNMLRFRFDAAYDNDRPDRAEFIYAKCGCFRVAGVDRDAAGPVGQGNRPIETSLDYQDFSTYLELAASNQLSGFVELPVRLVNGENIDNTGGLGDMNIGFKYALIACPDRFVTFQFRSYFPTGDADRGLGNDHVSLEPALLCFKRLSDNVTLEAELRDWIPVDGSDFAGNIIRYGVGLSYQTCFSGCRVTPVGEIVGWTVLDGNATVSPDGTVANSFVEDVGGDTIVNAKLGVRFGVGQGDLYVGYGHALTGEAWYEDIVRVEYRLNF